MFLTLFSHTQIKTKQMDSYNKNRVEKNADDGNASGSQGIESTVYISQQPDGAYDAMKADGNKMIETTSYVNNYKDMMLVEAGSVCSSVCTNTRKRKVESIATSDVSGSGIIFDTTEVLGSASCKPKNHNLQDLTSHCLEPLQGLLNECGDDRLVTSGSAKYHEETHCQSAKDGTMVKVVEKFLDIQCHNNSYLKLKEHWMRCDKKEVRVLRVYSQCDKNKSTMWKEIGCLVPLPGDVVRHVKGEVYDIRQEITALMAEHACMGERDDQMPESSSIGVDNGIGTVFGNASHASGDDHGDGNGHDSSDDDADDVGNGDENDTDDGNGNDFGDGNNSGHDSVSGECGDDDNGDGSADGDDSNDGNDSNDSGDNDNDANCCNCAHDNDSDATLPPNASTKARAPCPEVPANILASTVKACIGCDISSKCKGGRKNGQDDRWRYRCEIEHGKCVQLWGKDIVQQHTSCVVVLQKKKLTVGHKYKLYIRVGSQLEQKRTKFQLGYYNLKESKWQFCSKRPLPGDKGKIAHEMKSIDVGRFLAESKTYEEQPAWSISESSVPATIDANDTSSSITDAAEVLTLDAPLTTKATSSILFKTETWPMINQEHTKNNADEGNTSALLDIKSIANLGERPDVAFDAMKGEGKEVTEISSNAHGNADPLLVENDSVCTKTRKRKADSMTSPDAPSPTPIANFRPLDDDFSAASLFTLPLSDHEINDALTAGNTNLKVSGDLMSTGALMWRQQCTRIQSPLCCSLSSEYVHDNQNEQIQFIFNSATIASVKMVICELKVECIGGGRITNTYNEGGKQEYSVTDIGIFVECTSGWRFVVKDEAEYTTFVQDSFEDIVTWEDSNYGKLIDGHKRALDDSAAAAVVYKGASGNTQERSSSTTVRQRLGQEANGGAQGDACTSQPCRAGAPGDNGSGDDGPSSPGVVAATHPTWQRPVLPQCKGCSGYERISHPFGDDAAGFWRQNEMLGACDDDKCVAVGWDRQKIVDGEHIITKSYFWYVVHVLPLFHVLSLSST
jgi:hypothetical protein